MEAAKKERNIGNAERIDGSFESAEEEVAFKLPYGAYDYKVSLDDDDLDFLLCKGFAKILGQGAIKGLFFDAEIDLGQDLPLLLDSKKIRTEPGPSGILHTIHMEVHTATMSHANEHRGVLSAERDTFGKWSVLDYVDQPPLRELHEI